MQPYNIINTYFRRIREEAVNKNLDRQLERNEAALVHDLADALAVAGALKHVISLIAVPFRARPA